MRNILFLLMATILLSGPVAAQYHPSGPEATADRDSLLDKGLDELLSYLLLTKDDFIFRDDYTPADPFRLKIVDNLMKNPLLMNQFTVISSRFFHRFSDDPDSVMEYLAGTMGVERVSSPYRKSDVSDAPDRQSINEILLTELSAWTEAWEKSAGRKLDEDILYSLAEEYPNLLLEDVADKDKSAEEQDSIAAVEEEYAISIADMDKTLSLPHVFSIAALLARLQKWRDRHTPVTDTVGEPCEAADDPWAAEKGYRIAWGSEGNDIFRGDFDAIVDPGGDDNYYLTYDPLNPHPVIVIDFSGNDVYSAETEFALACGAFSYSLFVDYDGDDIYRGGNFSLGAGYFGVGILWDKKGNDSYFGDTFTQGAGTFGLGLLIDSEGSDTYTGNLFCQGFGFVNGVGGIIDKSGNDTYTVQPKYGDYIRYDDHYISLSQGFAYGIRPFLSGGLGFITDFGGNDTYVADIFGQGAAYWWSLGMLYDKSGNDQYLSHQYAQGSGTHMALGLLRDDEGNDVYRAYGVSQGCGHDYSCGWLLDRSGDDLYASFDLSQGAGSANGFGVFTDLIGDDRYYVMRTNNTQGYGNPRRGYGSIGVFLDMDGDDRYDGNGSNNRFWTTGSKWGGGLDRTIPVPDTVQGTEANDESTE